MARAPKGLDCELIEIADLSMYNQDLDRSPPASWVAFRKAVKACDGLLFVTPEYNRSVPGCLKNATDIGSRPDDESVFKGLPAAVVSVSPYSQGAFGANHALRQSFVYLDLLVMQQPEAYVGNAAELMNSHGIVTNKKTDTLFTDFMNAFERWVHAVPRAREPFADFMKRREKASHEYINGKADQLLALSTENDPATFFPPGGQRMQGASVVNASNAKGSKSFAAGSTGRFEVLQSASSGNLAFWSGVHHSKVKMKGKPGAMPMELRTTEVFRVEDGEWKLIHRHADLRR